MILITLEPFAHESRVELDGVDISRRLQRIEIDADVFNPVTRVRLTLLDDVVVVGEAGRVEFVKRSQ